MTTPRSRFPMRFLNGQQTTVFRFGNRSAGRIFSVGGWPVPRTRRGGVAAKGLEIEGLVGLLDEDYHLATASILNSCWPSAVEGCPETA